MSDSGLSQSGIQRLKQLNVMAYNFSSGIIEVLQNRFNQHIRRKQINKNKDDLSKNNERYLYDNSYQLKRELFSKNLLKEKTVKCVQINNTLRVPTVTKYNNIRVVVECYSLSIWKILLSIPKEFLRGGAEGKISRKINTKINNEHTVNFEIVQFVAQLRER